MANLLIAAAIDLSGTTGFGESWDRIASSLALGKAGELFAAHVPGGGFAWRRAQPLVPGHRQPPVRRGDPLVRPDGAHVLFAGRLMDRAELAAQLGVAVPAEDGELYARAFERLGDDCDRLVQGDYGVVQWWPDQNRVRLARSPFSDSPLHYWRDGSRLVVASIPRALFAAGAPGTRVSDPKLGDALMLNFTDGTASWYEGHARVACGTVVDHDPAGSRTRRYWSAATLPEVRFRRDEDYVEAADEQFRRATRAMLDGVKQPAISLSGGLDSQAVASYLVEQLPAGTALRAYTSVPMEGWTPPPRPGIFGNEADHVRALSAMYPAILPHFVSAPEARYGERLDAMFLLGSWPIHNEMIQASGHEAYALAVSHGCDAMFVGDNGNAGFSHDGWTGFPTWFRQGKWLRLLREVAASTDPRPAWRRFLSLAVMPNMPESVRRWRYTDPRLRPPPHETWCVGRPGFLETTGASERADAAWFNDRHLRFGDAAAWRDEIVTNMTCEAAEIELAFTLYHGITRRDPTAYRPLFELCAGFPDEQYLRGGEDRWLARRLLKGRIPEMVRTETRSGRVGSDWPIRVMREREEMLAELDAMRHDDRLNQAFDFDRMIANLAAFQGKDVPGELWQERINSGIGRALATARFVRYVEGRNAG